MDNASMLDMLWSKDILSMLWSGEESFIPTGRWMVLATRIAQRGMDKRRMGER
jgi:hypothetical protein